MSAAPVIHHPSSYRDPSGFIFKKDAVIYRQVNQSFSKDYDFFIQSGCYDHLVKKNLLIPHREVEQNFTGNSFCYKTLQPEAIPFISYPYEWPFNILKDAALLTLHIAKQALEYDMILKDATPYNTQIHKGRLIFIDTLSFEKFQNKPWIAYRQFCESFLSPLLLMHYSKKHLPELYTAWPNGIPLSVTQSLLPKRSKLSLHTYLHIHLHSRMSLKKQGLSAPPAKPFDKKKLSDLFTSLEMLIKKLKVEPQKSIWSNYYDEASQRPGYLDHKKQLLLQWLPELQPLQTAADLGANEGEFSKLASMYCEHIVAADFDPYCIDKLYLNHPDNKIHPIVLDLSNPSPAIGLNNEEREAFLDRLNVDIIFALALIHHLAIGKNIPFEKIANLFAKCCHYLVIEFVPKADEKVQVMLQQKDDIYHTYSEEEFINQFEQKFSILKREKIENSPRILFLMKKK